MKTLARAGITALIASLIASAPLPSAEAARGVNLGTLTCKTIPGMRTNLLLTSSMSLRCTYQTALGREHYRGKINLIGIDLSGKRNETFHFTVVGLTAAAGAHPLSGGYVGISVSAGLGRGFGSTPLVGGFKKGFSLVPSLDTFDGNGVTAGVTGMTLEAKSN